MKLIDCPVMTGEMCDYDVHMLPKAKALLDYLTKQPTFKWWNRVIKRPKSIRDAEREHTDNDGYSLFMGWDSFVCRNIQHPVTMELHKEFFRVFGRHATFQD